MTTNTVALHDWDGRVEYLADAISDSPFRRVILCVEERHLTWRLANVREAVEALQAYGLEVYVDPWGVGGFFAGEATHDGLNWATVEKWTDAVANFGVTGILWDEPRNLEGHTWEETLEKALSYTKLHHPELKNMLALQPDEGKDLSKWATNPAVDELSVSAYLFPPRINRQTRELVAEQVEKWHQEMPIGATAWVQTWGVGVGSERVPIWLVEEWRARGRDVNIWSWEACATASAIRSPNYRTIWEAVLKAL
jgi:hypothetical protein